MIIPRALRLGAGETERKGRKETAKTNGTGPQGGGGEVADLLRDRTQLHAESLMERFEPGISRMPRKAIAT
jgi:hypothetical protein